MNTSDRKQTPGIFDSMLELPLIKGISRTRLQEIVGHMKLHFVKVAAGDVVVDAGETCENLKFLLSGSLRLVLSDSAADFVVEQTLAAPQVITPDCLFGLNTTYPCRVEALTEVGIMEVSKEDYRQMLAMDSVFLFNYLNTACSASQRSQRGLLSIAAGSAAERVAYWAMTLTQPGATDIVLRSDSHDLHTIFGISAATLRTAVERMSEAGIIDDFSPRRIHITCRAALATLL